MINLTALEKTLEDIIFFCSFSHIYHLNSLFFFFFMSAFDQWFRVYHPFQSHSWIPCWISSRSFFSHSCSSTQHFYSRNKVIIWKCKSDHQTVWSKISQWFSFLLRKKKMLFIRMYQSSVICWCSDHKMIFSLATVTILMKFSGYFQFLFLLPEIISLQILASCAFDYTKTSN